MTDAGYDEWLDAISDGEGYYLSCPNGHGSLPPRRVCPHCGAPELERASLSTTGIVETYTTCYVGIPDFEDEEPYVSAIAEFDGVRLTGILRGIDPADATVGLPVEPDVGTNRTTGEDVLVLRVE